MQCYLTDVVYRVPLVDRLPHLLTVSGCVRTLSFVSPVNYMDTYKPMFGGLMFFNLIQPGQIKINITMG